jgi:RNA polymerase sigma-70 factor (ECF subfamily)
MDSTQDLTQFLRKWSDGDEQALEHLTPIVYRELHRIAQHYIRQERPEHTLQATALINEVYLRLIDWKRVDWKNRAHFFSVSAQLMRRILVDFARSRKYAKRGAGVQIVSLDEAATVSRDRAGDIAAVDEALKRLEAMDPRKGQIVELRFFGGMSIEEIAALLKVSTRTVLREWDLAKAWLHREIRGEKSMHSR